MGNWQFGHWSLIFLFDAEHAIKEVNAHAQTIAVPISIKPVQFDRQHARMRAPPGEETLSPS
jgi:hypothetical protein